MRNRKCCFSVLIFIFVLFALPAQALTSTDIKQQIKSETAILIDGDTGQVLFEKDMHRKMSPASITKIMTALLALENGDLSDTITMSYDAVFSVGRDTSHIALDEGEQLTLEQAMYALAIASANDAANGIAEHIGGTLDNFTVLMNDRAKEAGALNTNFVNAHGLSNEKHYTSAYDMARITMEAIKAPDFSKIFSAEKYEMPPTNKQPESRTFWCKNAMMVGKYKYDGIIAGKTGWTNDSQHTLVTVARRNGRTLIAVVMKSPNSNDKWEDTTLLLDYGFSEFITLSYTADELTKENYIVSDGNGNEINVNLSTSNAFVCLVPKTIGKSDISITYIIDANNITSNPQGKAVFTLKPEFEATMFADLGKQEMSVYINEINNIETNADDTAPISVGETQDETDELESKNIWSPVLIWILRIAGVFLGLYILLCVRRYIIIQRRRRRRMSRHNRRSH